MTKAFEEIKEGMLQAIAHAQGKPVPGTAPLPTESGQPPACQLN